MKKILYFLLIISLSAKAQTAPSHLKYFGFAVIDCGYDDPLDNYNISNYISEVDTFSNVAQMCVFESHDNIIGRVNQMNSHCVLPVIHLQSIFFEPIDTMAPSGEHYSLKTDFHAQWNTFKSINSSVLDSTKVGAFYIADEPFWNGISFQELDTVCSLIKSDFPGIPLLIVEASPTLPDLQVPTTIDWLAFDQYGIFNPSVDTSYLNNLALLKSKRSRAGQKIFLIVDDQWLPDYGAAGYPPDTIRYMVQHYYNLAASDTDIAGLLAYLWPGGLDDPQQLGVRDMPQTVIDKNIEIGRMIKARFSPCSTSGISDNEKSNQQIKVYPNPAGTIIDFSFKNSERAPIEIIIYNVEGAQIIETKSNPTNLVEINIENLKAGPYFYLVKQGGKILQRGKFLKLH